MRSQFFISFAVLYLVAGIVQSETVEVDENGDEYEVKRFNIGSRQINGGRPHCVITRRKRSPAVGQSGYGYGNDDDNVASENSFIGAGQYMTAPSVSPTMTFADNSSSDEGDHHVEEQENENNSVEQVVDKQHVNDQSAYSQPASNITNSDGIIFIQLNTPPKVDPLTHAVFELRPVYPNRSGSVNKNDMDHHSDAVEHGPNNDNNDDVVDDDKIMLANIRRRPKPKPNTFKPNRNPGQLANVDHNMKRKSNKKQTNTNQEDQNNSVPNRRLPENMNINRLPIRTQSGNINTRRKNQNFINKNRIQQQKEQQQMTNKQQQNTGNKKWGNGFIKDIVTLTTTGSTDDDRDVNCIFIEKAPTTRRTRTRTRTTRATTTTTTTTRRPFWRLLGRSAGGTSDNGYGRRKRYNLRFMVQ